MEIINKVIEILGDEYEVINAWNETEQINLNGVLAVTISNIELLNHGNTKDNKTTLNISGQYLTSEDVNQVKINTMYDYVFQTIDKETLVNQLDDVAGVIIKGGTISSDGETNNFTFVIQLYRCID